MENELHEEGLEIYRALSDEGVSRAGRHALPAHKKEDRSNRYGGQTGIRLRVTIPRVVQRNTRKSRPGIPAKGAWHAIFKLSLIPQSYFFSHRNGFG
jgi:hypothetical protein